MRPDALHCSQSVRQARRLMLGKRQFASDCIQIPGKPFGPLVLCSRDNQKYLTRQFVSIRFIARSTLELLRSSTKYNISDFNFRYSRAESQLLVWRFSGSPAAAMSISRPPQGAHSRPARRLNQFFEQRHHNRSTGSLCTSRESTLSEVSSPKAPATLPTLHIRLTEKSQP